MVFKLNKKYRLFFKKKSYIIINEKSFYDRREKMEALPKSPIESMLPIVLPIFGFVIGMTMVTLCAIALIKYIKKK